MKGNDFIFDCVHWLYYKCHKKSNKKATINHTDKKDSTCFQYAATVVLYHREIGKYYEKITKLKLFISKYTQEVVNYPSEKDHWKKNWEKNRRNISCLCFKT